MKKKLFGAMLLVLILCMTVQGTVAYFTASKVTHNVITTGEIDIVLVETWDHDKDPSTPDVAYPTDTIPGMMPGTEHSKIVQIQNAGPNPAWVRIKMNVSALDSKGAEFKDAKVVVNYLTGEGSSWLERDGIYYYKEKLEPGAITTPLFKTVSFEASMDNDYQGAKIEIGVTAEGIQYENNTNFDTAWPTGIEILKNIF